MSFSAVSYTGVLGFTPLKDLREVPIFQNFAQNCGAERRLETIIEIGETRGSAWRAQSITR